MKAVYLDDFTIQDPSDSTLGRNLSKPIEGLDYPAIRTSSFPRSGEDGIFISNQFYGERRISVEGTLHRYIDDANYEAERSAFLRSLYITKDSKGFLVPKVLRFITNDNRDLRVLVQVINKPTVSRDVLFLAEYHLDLLAHNQLIESFNATTVTVHPYTSGGVVVPFVVPFILGSGEGGIQTIVNGGDTQAYPTITLNGPLTNPRIQNDSVSGGTRWISLALSIGPGEQVVIDMLNKTIIQGGVTNRLSVKSEDSKWWWLEPGNNLVRLTTALSGEAGSADVTFRNSYLGI